VGPDNASSHVVAIMAGVADPSIYLRAHAWHWHLSNFEPWLPCEFGLVGATTGKTPDSPKDLDRAAA
jgi:hypothetical protein